MTINQQNTRSLSKPHWLIAVTRITIIASFAYGYWQLLSYLKRLSLQPPLSALKVPADITQQTSTLEKSMIIAKANIHAAIERRQLHNNQEQLVLCAGLRNFREPWARDLGFASYGLIEMGEWQTAKEVLNIFLINQRISGQFPVKIHSTNFIDRYLHSLFGREQPTDRPLKPKYITAHNTISLDGNALIIIAILNYAQRTGDHDYVRSHWQQLVQADRWMAEHADAEDGLLHQSSFADWADSVGRNGKIIYTNVLYWKVAHDLANAAEQYGYLSDKAHFRAKADSLQQAINTHFWRNDLGYFVTSHRFDNLSSCGNLMAVAWGLTTDDQANTILDAMARFNMASPVPTQVTNKPYPRKFIALENRMGGIAHYHTSAAWLWLGAWHVIALARYGRLEEAQAIRQRIADLIVRDGTVHEVYAPNGHYLSSLWYTSEAPLTWNAGMIIYAHYAYERYAAKAKSA